jgi:hypothetical protein
MVWRGQCYTLQTTACRSVERVSSLWDLMRQTAPRRFFMSVTAALGILRRMDRRQRSLPVALRMALEASAAGDSTQIRRLTPLETERLMGWPDHHTLVRGWRRDQT